MARASEAHAHMTNLARALTEGIEHERSALLQLRADVREATRSADAAVRVENDRLNAHVQRLEAQLISQGEQLRKLELSRPLWSTPEGAHALQLQELNDRLEREERAAHRLQIQLIQTQNSAASAPALATINEAASAESVDGEALIALAAKDEQLAIREAEIDRLRSDTAALQGELTVLRERDGSMSEERVRHSLHYQALESRLQHAEAQRSVLGEQLQQTQKELQALRTQHRHDQEHRSRLQQAQLTTQEEKIQAMEAKLKRALADRERALHEAEVVRARTPGPALLRQLSEEIKALEQRLQDAQTHKAQCLDKIAELRRTCARLEKGGSSGEEAAQRSESLQKEVETVMSAMATMEHEYVRIQSEHAKALRQLADVEDASMHLASERARLAKQQILDKRRLDAQGEKINKGDERYKAQSLVLSQSLAKAAALETQLRSQGEETQLLASRCESLEHTNGELMQLLDDLRRRLEDHATEEQKRRSQGTREHSALDLERMQRRKAQEELALLRRQVETVGRRGGESGTEAQLERYKALVRCSVCNEGQKNAIITRCFHVFCRSCIDDNLNSRKRMCPQCGSKFGEADVKPIYL